MKDRFDLENEIQMLALFADDIKMVSDFLMESENIDDDVCDKAVNALNGISALLEMKTDALMDTMCQCLKLDNYRENTDTIEPTITLDDSITISAAQSRGCYYCGCTNCGDPCCGMETPIW